MSTSSAKTSPEFTPASTPSEDSIPRPRQEQQQATTVEDGAIMAETPNGDPHDEREHVSATSSASESRTLADSSAPANSAPAADANTKLEGDPPMPDSTKTTELKSTIVEKNDSSTKTVTACKKHRSHEPDVSNRKRALHKAKKKCHKKPIQVASPSSSSSSSATSSSDSEPSEETTQSSSHEANVDSEAESSSGATSSSSDSDEVQRRAQQKRKQKHNDRVKAKRILKLKKMNRAREKEEVSSSDSSDSEEDKAAARKLAKRKAKRSRSKEDSSAAQQGQEGNAVSDEMALLKAKEKLAALQLRLVDGHQMKGQKVGKHCNPDKKIASQKSKDKRQMKKKKAASKVAFKRVDQLWDSTIHNYRLTETLDDLGADEWDQYIFTVRRRFDWENKYLETVVDIKSKPLRDALSTIMDGVKGVSLVQETAAVDPNMLFLYLEETRQFMKELKQLAKTEKKKKARKVAAAKAAHLKILIKYLDEDYAQIKKTLYPLLNANMITFDLLWALFKPNTIAYTPTYGTQDEPRAFKIEYASKESSFMKGQWYNIEGRYLEYDGKSFGMGTMAADVESFKGARKITSLACYPLKYHRAADTIRTQLIERGKKFVSLSGMSYRYHHGMAFYKKRRSIIKVNINGRVMIDPAIHRRINPNYPISTVRPKDNDSVDASDDDGSDDCCCGMSDSDTENTFKWHRRDSDQPKMKFKVVRDKDGVARVVEIELDENGNATRKENLDSVEGGNGGKTPSLEQEFSEEELLIASPVVLGFAFSEKLWLEFSVSGISDIIWNEEAFESLVLPDNQKSIVRALVESHTFHAAQNIDDVIQGKGKGLVAVLHGPPGTGKTLTAEGIAELLKRPLYMVSAGELGTDSRTLEAELNKILDIAHSWGAVLLLDEADIFLEKRTIQDIHRNALVSIFLRLLEYFQGILFLTTNRVETFDDAFQSRIHVALRYGDLTTKAKRSVWKMFLEKVQAMEGVRTAKFTDKDYDVLSRHNLNGRQIKNSVRTAQALAVNENTPLSMAHIKCVLEVAETFDNDLRGGTGYIDAMRSYT